MIDIHCHILYGVDDGSPDQETSRRMLDRMAQSGVTAVIATPHFRHNMFPYPQDKIEEAYDILREYAASKHISLYPGCEYHVCHDIFEHLETGRVHTLADTGYILTEYSYSDSLDRILNYSQELIMRGWKPVIAHIERCEVFQRKPALAQDVLDSGTMIQVNANAVLGLDGRAAKKTARKLLDLDLVDFIASDAHDLDERVSHMEECFAFVRKKYGDAAASFLFEENQAGILIDSRL